MRSSEVLSSWETRNWMSYGTVRASPLPNTRMAPGGRPGLLGLSSRFSCWLKSDLGTWSIVSPCARTDPIQIARIFENLDAPGFYFMRNYVLDIPNWQNVPRWSQSSAFSLGALWFSWYYMKTVILVPYVRGGVMNKTPDHFFLGDPLAINCSAIESRRIGLSKMPGTSF